MKSNIDKQMTHIKSLETLVKSKDIKIEELQKEISRVKRFSTNALKEKQDEINLADEMHYNECEELRVEIALLKQQLVRKQN